MISPMRIPLHYIIYTGYPLAEDISANFTELSYVQCNMQCVCGTHGWGSWTLLVPGDVLKVVLVQTGQHFSLTAHHHWVLCIWAVPHQTDTYTQTTTPTWLFYLHKYHQKLSYVDLMCMAHPSLVTAMAISAAFLSWQFWLTNHGWISWTYRRRRKRRRRKRRRKRKRRRRRRTRRRRRRKENNHFISPSLFLSASP